MRDEYKWPAMHAYRKAVALGEAPPIRCPDCRAELVPVIGKKDLPALKCLSCRAVWSIGQDTWDQIKANISESAYNIKEKGY